MTRVHLVQKDQASSEVAEIYSNIEESGAKVLNLYKVLAHNHYLLRNCRRLGGSLLTKTGLSPRLREIAILRVAKLTGCEYVWTQHFPIALQIGMSSKQANAISNWKDSESVSIEERSVLQYTDEVTQNVSVSDKTFLALRQLFSEQEVVELTCAIGYWGMLARLLVPLQVEIDPIGSTKEIFGRGG